LQTAVPWVTAIREGSELVISVRDNGLGIAPNCLPDIFKLFAQGERSMARSEGGLGIGLTIVRKLAELHGGRIDAHSDGPDRGSNFTLRLPACERPAATPPAPAPPERRRPLRVLIVDDNVDTAQALGRLLTRAGHQVAMAHEGEQALEQARAQMPQAVVLDIGLPGMDGFEVARRLRREPMLSETLLIAVTGYGQEGDRRQAMEAGFDHHLVKPVGLEELKKLLAGI
jgi:CheY-like chemotaxis protein